MSAPAYGPRPVSADRFVTVVGRPATIALKFRGPGKVTRTGNVMYTLTSNLVAFFPPEVAREIDALGLGDQEPFTVCHHGSHFWDVQRAAPAPQVIPPPATAPAPVMQSAVHIPPPPAPVMQSAVRTPVNGQGEGFAEVFARCYTAAIDLTLVQLEAARAKGLHILPTHEGLQAAAATLFIAETRR